MSTITDVWIVWIWESVKKVVVRLYTFNNDDNGNEWRVKRSSRQLKSG